MENIPQTVEQLHVLSEQHPYYSSDNNYHSNDESYNYNSFDEFIDEMGDSDEDLDLVFRWDLQIYADEKPFLEIFIIQQRRGNYCYHRIDNITDSDVPKIMEYLKSKKNKLMELWNN